MRLKLGILSVFALVVVGLAVVPSGAVAQESVSIKEVSVRDELIAAQENLLNAYRCLFGVDLDVVPGGCPDPDVVAPGQAPFVATQADLELRNQLIAAQEALLNVYRCAHSVDLELVSESCGASEPQSDSDSGLVDRGDFTAVSSGGSHSCALEGDGQIVCWGDNSKGQATPPEGRFVAVSSSSSRSCAVDVEGGIACWGSFASGGISPSGEEASPPAGQFADVSAGERYSCALDFDAQVHCWGVRPVQGSFALRPDYWMPFEGRFVAVSTERAAICALDVDGGVVCNRAAPAPPSEGRFVAISSGTNHYAGGVDVCAIDVAGRIECWGGALGDVSPPEGHFTAVSVGHEDACALDVEGQAVCWSYEREYRDGVENEYSVVTLVTPPGEHLVDLPIVSEGRFTSVSAGGSRSCGLSTDSRVFCWGAFFGSDDVGPPETGVWRWLNRSRGQHYVCLQVPGRDVQEVCWGADHPAVLSG